ncbi:MAG: hypothetical protein JWP64_6244 [Pseudonocardia sp.]|jgi:hypothetical protein|nr:hypothetical protein [Pseudonocardia sp.]
MPASEPPATSATVAAPLRLRLMYAVLRAVFGYGLLVWVYLAVNSLSHPETVGQQVTHFLPWPTEGQTALGCFVLSAASFFLLRVRSHRPRWEG